jgi:hypothetical protein
MKSFKSLLLASALGLFIAVPLARAAEQEVPLKETPESVQKAIQREEGKGAKNTQVYQVVKENQDYYMVHYVAADGKHMRLRVDPHGKVLARGETRKQANKDRLAAAKTAQERAQIEQQLQQEREAADRRTFEAWQAAQASQASSSTPARSGTPRAADAGSQQWFDLKDLSQEYNAKNHERVNADQVPAAVRKTLDQEAINADEKDYYRYVVDGQTFYSVHYTTPGDRRMVARAANDGKFLGRHDLLPQEQLDEHSAADAPRTATPTDTRRETPKAKDNKKK